MGDLLKQVDYGYISEELYGPIPALEKLPKPPTTCTNCGRALVFAQEDGGFSAYGGRIIIPTWRCPKTLKHGFWDTGWTLHDEYAPSHFLDWSWQRRYYR